MAATSGDKGVLKEFSKRVDAAPLDYKAILFMPSLNLKEMGLLYPELEPEELQFKFDVIGGNPRRMSIKSKKGNASKFLDLVVEVVRMMFGEEYVPTEGSKLTKKQEWGLWAITNVVEELGMAGLKNTDSSFFKEYDVVENFETEIEQYSSVFLSLVAKALKKASSKAS